MLDSCFWNIVHILSLRLVTPFFGVAFPCFLFSKVTRWSWKLLAESQDPEQFSCLSSTTLSVFFPVKEKAVDSPSANHPPGESSHWGGWGICFSGLFDPFGFFFFPFFSSLADTFEVLGFGLSLFPLLLFFPPQMNFFSYLWKEFPYVASVSHHPSSRISVYH